MRQDVRCSRICGRHQSKTPTLQSDFMKQNEIKLIKILIHKVATDGSAVDQSVDHLSTILMEEHPSNEGMAGREG